MVGDSAQEVKGSSKRKRGTREENAEAGPSRPSQSSFPVKRVDSWYTHELDSHIISSKTQVLGLLATVPNRGAPTARRATIVPPLNSIFTPEDKAKFFAALARHSRFRSDLIAKDVGKPLVEIEGYLDLLEIGWEAVQKNKGNRVGQRPRPGRYKRRYWWEEGLAPSAREVGAEWIEEEDGLAARLLERNEEGQRSKIAQEKALSRAEEKRVTVKPFREPSITRAARDGEKEAVEELERKWRVEDWSEELTRRKMDILNPLMKASSLRTIDLYHQVEVDGADNHSLNDDDEENEEESSAFTSKMRKIDMESRAIDLLQSIKRTRRTPEQRAALHTLTRRRDARTTYREQRLLESGLTLADIEEGGGADVVYLNTSASRETGSMSPVKKSSAREAGSKSPVKKVGDALISEESDEERKILKELGVPQDLVKRGWDVLDLIKLDQVTRMIRETVGDTGTADSALLCSTLSTLHTLLLAHLAPLVLHSILLAEQAYATSPELDPDPDITAEHVAQALAMRDEDPKSVLLEFLNRYALLELQDDEEEDASDSEAGDTSSDMDTGTARDAEIPRQESQDTLPLRAIVGLPTTVNGVNGDRVDDVTNVQDDADAEFDDDHDEDDDGDDDVIRMDDSDAFSETSTDKEDMKLDRALEAMDDAYDDFYEHTLWDGHKMGKQFEDWSDPWGRVDDPKAQGGLGLGKETRQLLASAQARRDALMALVLTEYITELDAIFKERRWRRAMRQRSVILPTTKLRGLASKKRTHKSAAIVIDTDDDDDDGSEGEAEESEGSESPPEPGNDSEQ